ncbi:MAG: hypothetical protein ABJM43_20410 [Paracoccaceae bacterium]
MYSSSENGKKARKALFVAVTVGLLCNACTVTTKFDHGQAVERSFGFTGPVMTSCKQAGQSIRTQVLGLGLGKSGAVLGYAQDDVICLPVDSCVAIFVIENLEQAQAVRTLFPNLGPDCIVGNATFNTLKEG